MDTLQLYESPLFESSKDSTLASHQLTQVVKHEVPSPVSPEYVTLGQVTTTYPNTTTPASCMPDLEQLGSGSEDSQSIWEATPTVKSEDFGYSACSRDQGGTPTLTPLTSPTVSSSSSPNSPRSSSGKGSRKRSVEKGTEEYVEKRARNNVAVRKSRAKAKEKQKQTETRVSSLVSDNERLQKKVDLLTKELNVLKGLFINVGAALPSNFAKLLES